MNKIHLLTSVASVTLSLVLALTATLAFSTGMVKIAASESIPVIAIQETAMPVVDVPKHRSIVDNLLIVFHVGREVGNPETLQAILMQESGGSAQRAVGNIGSPVGKRSYGLMQVQLVAARSILLRNPKLVDLYFPDRVYKSLADEEIIALLLTNDEANARIAAHHFKLYLAISHGDWNRAVAAYSAGIGGVNNIPNPSEYPYVQSIKAKMTEVVRPFNRTHKLLIL